MIQSARFLLAAGLVPAAVAAAAPAAVQAQEITWRDDKAVALGTGCSSLYGDTVFISAGNDVAVLFSRFGVELPAGGANTSLSDLKSCLVRIPATIQGGFKITELTQMITYGVNKSGNTSGEITTASTFFNLPVAKFNVHVPFGARQDPTVSQSTVTPFLVATACSKTVNGLYQSNMAVSGNRSNAGESLILAMQGLDLRYDVLLELIPC